MLARIALETGFTLTGRSIGAPLERGGEVVFHTGMTGYQEILTDPSYAGQVVVFTASHIGNYGIHAGDEESALIQPSAILVRDLCRRTFHRRAESGLEELLRRSGVPALADVDTRALTIAIRDHGTCRGWIGTGDPAALVEKAKALPPMDSVNWVDRVTCSEPWSIEPPENREEQPFEVAVLDLGVKKSILRSMVREGCRIRVFPAGTDPERLLAPPTEGIFLSNGPGDPATLPQIVDQVGRIVESGVPVFGICLGHQLLARALGAETEKLPFGHHGANHPVQSLATGRVEITSQNHNYTVIEKTLPAGSVRVTHRSLNDGTVEGIEMTGAPLFSVQYHPEAAPGPSDSIYLFRRFRANMSGQREKNVRTTRGGSVATP